MVGIFSLISRSTIARSYDPGNDSSGFFKSFDGTKIYYEVKGSGAPVLLVHGFVVNGESWKKTALYDDLLKSGFKVITLDLRGNGKSDKPHDPAAYANDAEAKDIMGLMQMLAINQYNVVGYSRGSIITARLLVFDKRISKAVMGGIGIDFTNPEWPRRVMFYKALSGEPTKELEGLVKRVQELGLDQQALACMQKEQPSTSKEALGAIKQPVMIICGDKDEDNGSSLELVKVIPKAIHETVPGNHGSASATKEFSEKVIAFISK
ncbi:MAG: alpha/beta fold hydrolase [Bacteroidetes bacterium]|nr:alpha/beta fold hydrolase [Bacteroidota bacterium]